MAEKLGVPCYYKEMTALAAQESGLAKEFISGINSDESTVMRDLYLSTNVVRQAQDKAINMIGNKGSCGAGIHPYAEGLSDEKGDGDVW